MLPGGDEKTLNLAVERLRESTRVSRKDFDADRLKKLAFDDVSPVYCKYRLRP